MGFIGGALRAGSGSPKFDLQRTVKNQGIADANTGLLSDFQLQRGDQNKALGDFTARWLASQPGAEQNAKQEAGAVGQYYNGQIDNILANLRNRRQKAVMDAANRGLAYATRNRSLANLGAEGGDSSYNRQLGTRNSSDILTQAAVDNANQERSDFNQVQQGRLGLLGKRQGLIDTATGRLLYPTSVGQQILGGNIKNLGGLSNIDLANTFYGLSQHKTGLQKWADFADAADQGIMNAASIVGSLYGGGGGGQTKKPKPQPQEDSSNFAGYGSLGGYYPPSGGAVGGWQDSTGFAGGAGMYAAEGGNVRKGGLHVIGEEGPEVFVPKQSGTVIPNPRTNPGARAYILNLMQKLRSMLPEMNHGIAYA